MSRWSTTILLALLLAAGAAVAAPPFDLPECVRHAAFAGITQTDAEGNVIGTPDPTDWVCPADAALDVPPGPIPPQPLCMQPAYPNPASGIIRFRYSLPQAANVSLVVYGQHGKHGRAFPVKTVVSGMQAAGQFMANWDLRDDQGAPLPPDIYRVVLVVGDQERWGDIEIR